MNRNKPDKESVQTGDPITKEKKMKNKEAIRNRSRKVSLFTTLSAGLLITAIALISQPFSADAQGRFGTPGTPDEIVQILTDRLDMTTEQAEAIRPILEERDLKRKEVWQKGGADRWTNRTEMQKLRLETEEKLGEILTEDQLEEYLEFRQEQRGTMKRGKFRGDRMGKGLNRTPEQAIERLTWKLDLTEEQAAVIQPIIEDSFEKRREVFDRYWNQNQNVRQAKRAEMQAIGDETHEQLSTILNDEQMEDLDRIRELKRSGMGKRGNCRL